MLGILADKVHYIVIYDGISFREPTPLLTVVVPPKAVGLHHMIFDVVDIDERLFAIDYTLQCSGSMQCVPHLGDLLFVVGRVVPHR